MADSDRTEALLTRVREAAEREQPLFITGSGSKSFYGRRVEAQALPLQEHRGILSYEPTELVITARAGTPLAELEAALAAKGQMLPFEPPRFGGAGTVGGAVAAGLAGPRRFSSGGVRDYVLGLRLINGQGELLQFGGQVMKNVAGYDVSRLMVGALGTLGVISEVSLKVLPAPSEELTLQLALPSENVAGKLDEWTAAALPVTAAAHDGQGLRVRLSGPRAALEAAERIIGGERQQDSHFWHELRDHRLPFFTQQSDERLWRLGLPPHCSPPALPGRWLSEWGGRLLWLQSEAEPETIRAAAEHCRGHAVLFDGGDGEQAVFPALDPVTRKLHMRLKQALDPRGIFNPGRLSAEL